GRDKNTDRQYLFGYDGTVNDETHPIARWRSLNKTRPDPEPDRRRKRAERYIRRERERERGRDGYFYDEPVFETRPPHLMRFLSESRESRGRRPRGVSIDGYIPPE